ncbi:MAG: type II toxin-antitoxin system RelE/ParE family toxin [Ignavibacteriales bacterium]|nr:type II toxin-antitoxin system RelE/ParE family toxin [Ignavibacteriales bacterium]
MDYQIKIKPAAQKDLDKFPVSEIKKIIPRLMQLSRDPRPIGIQKLTNREGYRIRSGKYRILFEINDKLRLVNIFRIKHRKEAYK